MYATTNEIFTLSLHDALPISLVPVGAHVVDRVVALGDLGVEIRAPGGAGQVAGGPVLHGVEAGAGPDRAGDRGAVQGGWVAVGRTGVGADGTEVAVVALSEREEIGRAPSELQSRGQ